MCALQVIAERLWSAREVNDVDAATLAVGETVIFLTSPLHPHYPLSIRIDTPTKGRGGCSRVKKSRGRLGHPTCHGTDGAAAEQGRPCPTCANGVRWGGVPGRQRGMPVRPERTLVADEVAVVVRASC